MNKKLIVMIMLAIVLMGSGLVVIDVQANNSYLVYGIVLKNNGAPNDGATVTATNDRTLEKITNISYTDDLGQVGTYQVNLGNMPAGWLRGDNVTISATSGSWTGSRTFTIPATGTMYEMENVSMNKTTGGGGGRERGGADFLSNPIGPIIFIPIAIIIIVILFFFMNSGRSGNIPYAGKRKRRKEKKFKAKL